MFEQSDGVTTRVLQSVAVDVDESGAIAAIEGTALYRDDASGESRGDDTAYDAEEVVGDLPVRVTTQYRTVDGVGSALEGLTGYSGRVEIGVTVENLTVAPTMVSYDAAGESRESPALVGTPLSVSASTKLDGISASDVVFSSDAERTTNGVVSSGTDGDAIVQWATLLAPPQSEATATFLLVADVEEFSLPDIDIAVQAGLHTDLSFSGVVASAFDDSATSDLALQQRTIALVAEVNDVLSRAGSTITEVRDNLNDTSDSLGARAAQQLTESTRSLASGMQSVAQQLTTLDSDLSSTVAGTRSAMQAQLSQIVASMDAMLGDTAGEPAHQLDGEGCAAIVLPRASSGTLYSTFLHLSSLLDGYSEANEGCRDQVVAEIDRILGPTEPSDATCAEPSMTCALYDAKRTVAEELIQLVAESEGIIDELNIDNIAAARATHNELGEILLSLDGHMAGIGTGTEDATLWGEIETALESATDRTAELEALYATATDALAALTGGGTSVRQQHEDLANLICDLASDPGATIDPARIEQLRAHVVDTTCDGTAQDPALVPETGALDTRLDDQIDLWNQVRAATAPGGSSLGELQQDLDALDGKLNELRDTSSTDAEAMESLVADLREVSEDALTEHEELGSLLEVVEQNQVDVKTMLGGELQRAVDVANTNVADKTDAQIDAVTGQVDVGRQALIDAYNSTILGLSTTSDVVLGSGKRQIDDQRSALEEAQTEATAALDERTVSALERISAGTAASTRDVEAASVLLSDSLNKVLLDLGDPDVAGSGILGAMSASAAKSDTADYQLALASQRAAGYANVRSEDIAGIRLRQAQFSAALESAATLPAFHLEVPAGAASQTIFAFHLGGAEK
ncbi:MAG: hypothetical protein ACQEW8_15535 [Actinomycetota bacterium]